MTPELFIGLHDKFKLAYQNKDQHYIISLACAIFNITVIQLTSKSRVMKLVKARAITAYFLRYKTKLSLMKIGELLGGRHHSSVLHLIQQVENKEYDSMMLEMYRDFEKNFNR